MTARRPPPEETPALRRSESGVALVVTLWAVALLSLASTTFTTATRTQTNLTRNLIENARAEAVADAGVYRAVAALLDPDPARRPRLDGAAYRWPFGGGEATVSVQDEAGRIDLNAASDELLKGLLRSVGVAPQDADPLADAIRDFADRDHLRRLNGAEDEQYRAAGLEDGAKDAPFQTVAELQQVLGVPLDLYDRLAPLLTVHSGAVSVDPATAPPAALQALPGATAAGIDAVLAARRRGASGFDAISAEAGGPDGAAPVMPVLGEPAAAHDAARAASLFAGRGHSVFTVTATARTPGGGVFERQALVRLTGDPLQPFIVYEWRRGWTAGASPGQESLPRP